MQEYTVLHLAPFGINVYTAVWHCGQFGSVHAAFIKKPTLKNKFIIGIRIVVFISTLHIAGDVGLIENSRIFMYQTSVNFSYRIIISVLIYTVKIVD